MEQVLVILESLALTDIVDIAIVTLLFYSISFMFRGTQAVALFRGIALVVIGLISLAAVLRLQALSWLLANSLTALVIAIPVIFQPEIRRVLERLGRSAFFGTRLAPEATRISVIDEIYSAVTKLSSRRHGALIVLQRNSSVQEYIRTGISLEAIVTADLLATLFWPRTELHDGAVIIDDSGRIAAASCVLPITASRNLPDPNLGTRHRAAVGISEIGDALCVVVSEETGKISLTNGGRMILDLDAQRLKLILGGIYGPAQVDQLYITKRIRELRADFKLRLQTLRRQGAQT
ncbi:MAG: diadenylate cyclase CdaA [Chloroflexi bacterium]|nr:diadenylate cyclase CdaA [Chloroflexota bacterium]MCY3583216.1 diadenylate cyclase CdaA [Chloroflexota bacterium]MCY3715947.1 diadenylate cyclase CdaA [Chloroflexota bacterium]MDE2651518.1 diadenylate cyclase CdaA [Chloroflexota bacterium]MXV93673.1 TIGR00159 family protein [Chloroflexota bacterium]